MKNIRSHWSLFMTMILLATALWIIGTGVVRSEAKEISGNEPFPQKGFNAPDIRLENINTNEIVDLEDYRGQIVLVNFWASWCAPCRSEMPAMQAVYEEFQDQDFVLLGVNVTQQDNLENVRSFTDSLQITFPILLDIEGAVSNRYQVRALPSTFLIDREGKIIEVLIGGPIPEPYLETLLSSYIRKSE